MDVEVPQNGDYSPSSTKWNDQPALLLTKHDEIVTELLRADESDIVDLFVAQALRPHISKYWRTIGSICLSLDGIGGAIGFKTSSPNGS